MGLEILNLELKEADLSDQGIFKGYASTFGHEDLGSDIVVKGAFDKTLKEIPPEKIKVLYMHDWMRPIGLGIKNRIYPDDKGLYFEAQIDLDDPDGKQMFNKIKKGIVDGVSIGYNATKYSFDEKHTKRYLEEVKLREISPVTWGMNEQALVTGTKCSEATFAFLKAAKDQKSFERALREVAYLDPNLAKFLAAGHKFSDQREAELKKQAVNAEYLEVLKKFNKEVSRICQN
jgi:HK97 family phage prohead protease